MRRPTPENNPLKPDMPHTAPASVFSPARACATGGNGVNFLLRDHLSSMTRRLDYTGAALSDTLFKAWGEARYTSCSAPTTMKYTGQREESGLGLYFYHARWYDAYPNRAVTA